MKLNKNSTINAVQKKINNAYVTTFGNTPLSQRLDDIAKEALELHRYIDLPNLKEEAGDLLCSLAQLINECEWDATELIEMNLDKIRRRKFQYQALGRKKQVALLGGAFDPITMGHVALAKFVLNSSRLFDEVHFLPCARHLHKKLKCSAAHRLNMCRIACENDPRLKVNAFEIEHDFMGETYHMVKQLLQTDCAKNECDFSMIIGLDNANTFDQWVNYIELERMMRFVVVPRTGEKRNRKVNWYLKSPHIFLESEKPLIEMSSTVIREAIAYRDPRYSEPTRRVLSSGLAPGVYAYIQEHNLYLPTKQEGK